MQLEQCLALHLHNQARFQKAQGLHPGPLSMRHTLLLAQRPGPHEPTSLHLPASSGGTTAEVCRPPCTSGSLS